MLSGKIALVTGGARGIGAACSRVLASEGAKVVVADLKADSCNATLKVWCILRIENLSHIMTTFNLISAMCNVCIAKQSY